MATGDHIYVEYPGYTHHGIDLGDGTLVEYGGKGTGVMAIRRVLMSKFAERGTVHLVSYAPGAAFPPEQVVARALARLKEQRYSVFTNNCEHFAIWCKTGHQHSPQGEIASVAVAGLAVLGLAKLMENA
jgi:hypothetical protein